MALVPIYKPESAARILWRLILTSRARLEDFDNPPPGYVGNPETFRNLAREYEHLKEDPKVIAAANHYLETNDRNLHPQTVQLTDPRDFTPASDPQPDVRPTPAPVQLARQEDPSVSDE